MKGSTTKGGAAKGGSTKGGSKTSKSSNKGGKGGKSSSKSGGHSLPHVNRGTIDNPTMVDGKLAHDIARKLPTFTLEQLHKKGQDTFIKKMHQKASKRRSK